MCTMIVHFEDHNLIFVTRTEYFIAGNSVHASDSYDMGAVMECGWLDVKEHQTYGYLSPL
jgi:hypothetical protein